MANTKIALTALSLACTTWLNGADGSEDSPVVLLQTALDLSGKTGEDPIVYYGEPEAEDLEPAPHHTAKKASVEAAASSSEALDAARRAVRFGNASCPCIGIEGITGSSKATTLDGISFDYPSEVGSRCEKWDAGVYPGQCNGAALSDFCIRSWCYVDPCNCNMEAHPHETYVLDGARYHGNQLFYSYATCGEVDSFQESSNSQALARPKVTIQELCDKEKWDEDTYGLKECPCVGISNMSGFTDVFVKNKTISKLYPSDLGSYCKAWDADLYPGRCDGKEQSDFCLNKWCYVDSTNCVLPSGPFDSDYAPHLFYHGHNIKYSYVTCQYSNTYFDTAEFDNTPSAQGAAAAAAASAQSAVSASTAANAAASAATAAREEAEDNVRVADEQLHAAKDKNKTATKNEKKALEAADVAEQAAEAAIAAKPALPVSAYGDNRCPCIGVGGISGQTLATASDGSLFTYPADVGSRCAAWDEGRYPGDCDTASGDNSSNKSKSSASPSSWCSRSWCYVDPCNCEIPTSPSKSTTMDLATYHGLPLFYSYATCGEVNTFDAVITPSDLGICETPWNAEVDGRQDCKCLGIRNLSGYTDITLKEVTYTGLYPADLGSYCNAWDSNRYPGQCDVAEPADFCYQKFCYVDADDCALASTTQVQYTGARYHGQNVRISYDTCGAIRQHLTLSLVLLAAFFLTADSSH